MEWTLLLFMVILKVSFVNGKREKKNKKYLIKENISRHFVAGLSIIIYAVVVVLPFWISRILFSSHDE